MFYFKMDFKKLKLLLTTLALVSAACHASEFNPKGNEALSAGAKPLKEINGGSMAPRK